MASDQAGKGGQILSSVLRFLKIFILNSWRRLLMLGHYTVICFHQQRLRRAWRLLGQRVHRALEGGEVNPMLTGEVKDSLTKAQAIQAAKGRRYQAIASLREKIRASRAQDVPPPPKAESAPAREPESAPVQEARSEAAKESGAEPPQG